MKSYDQLEEEISDLEKSLETSLSPFLPSPVFIHELKQKLATPRPHILEKNSLTVAYLLIAFGLFFGIFIFWLVRKIVRNRNKLAN